MSVKAKLRHLRIAPRKVRLVADLIRGKSAEEAQVILNFTVKKAAKNLLKLLKGAVASARYNSGGEESNFYVSEITVDEGPTLKRWRARARGQAGRIHKKTSHITIALEQIKQTAVKPAKPASNEVKDIKTAPKVPEKGKAGVEAREVRKKAGGLKPKEFHKSYASELKKHKLGDKIKRVFRRKAF